MTEILNSKCVAVIFVVLWVLIFLPVEILLRFLPTGFLYLGEFPDVVYVGTKYLKVGLGEEDSALSVRELF